jgi:hypothetical protein
VTLMMEVTDRQTDGETALRNLDFAAHTSYIDDHFFQRYFIPQQASKLAKRLCHRLYAFFDHDDGAANGNSDLLGQWTEQEPHLVELFEHSLRLKAQLVVSMHQFEAVLHSPGSPFDKTIMEAEAIQGDNGLLKSPEKAAVRLCLLPSIYVFERNAKLVEYNNFVKGFVGKRREIFNPTKALVIVGPSFGISG